MQEKRIHCISSFSSCLKQKQSPKEMRMQKNPQITEELTNKQKATQNPREHQQESQLIFVFICIRNKKAIKLAVRTLF